MASPRNDFAIGLFIHRSEMPASAAAVFAWHCRPQAFLEVQPPWERVEVIEQAAIENGAEWKLRTRIGPLATDWTVRIYDVHAGRRFRDLQLRGPFRYWQHSHLMEPIDERHSILEDRITFALWGGGLAHALVGGYMRRRLQRMFAYRHEVTRAGVATTPSTVPPSVHSL